jgi:hypothetical protein
MSNLSNEDLQKMVDRRNRRLVSLISKLKLGIHILNFPEKPMFYSPDYRYEYSGYIKNFNLVLLTQPYEGEITFQLKLEEEIINDEAIIEQTRFIFSDWINNCEHKRCYTVKVKNTNLYVSGFNHHDRLNHKRPYPVFSEFNPHIYYEKERAFEIVHKFSTPNTELYIT